MNNGITILIIGLAFVTQAPAFARSNKPVARHVHKKHVKQGALNQSELNAELNAQKQVVQKSSAKNRQRMSAAKIAGVVVATVLSVVAFGALLFFGIGLFLLQCGL